MVVRGLLQLALVAVARASIQAANSSTSISYSGEIHLQGSSGNRLADLVPITRAGTSRDIEGELFLTTASTYPNISEGDITFISCNNDDWTGNIKVDAVFEEIFLRNIIGAIFYSTGTDYCNYTDPQPQLQDFPIYSMVNTSSSTQIFNNLTSQAISEKYFVKIQRSGGGGEGTHDGQQNGQNPTQPQNPLGPSPSTAVAMIILYSITGIITALFLVIIITGAIRAHRHPDRYGPRDVLGRPRQSRARGLGRAILDTIPIVKFGEKEPPKPTDVEMGSTAEARGVAGTDANADANANVNAETGERNADTQEGTETREASSNDTPRNASVNQQMEMESGIAAAQPVVAASSASQDDASPDEGLGCSICTEDFEKGQDIRVLPCNHKFHPECVDPWLLNVSSTCPLCRVDLRPVTSHSSAEASDPDMLAPPLQSDGDASHRRRSAFMRDILSFRSRPNASPDERISALRRLREHRHNHSGDVASGSTEDVANQRRSRRMSARLSGVFHGRSWRNGREESPTGEASSNTAAGPLSPRREEDEPSESSGSGGSGGGSNGTEPPRPAQNQEPRP